MTGEGRTLPKRDYLALKSASKVVIDHCGGPSFVADEVTRVQKAMLSKSYSTHDENAGTFLPIDVIADLEAHCGEPIVTRVLAEMQGYVLKKLPRGAASTDWLGHLSNLIEGGGDVSSGLLRAAADQCVTPDEALAEKDRAIRLREDLTAYIASLNLIIDGRGS